MIHIYNVDNTNFSVNGDCILFPSSAEINVEINDQWQAEIVQPLDEEQRWKYIKEGAVLKMPSFNGEQLFRIKSVSKTDTEITATAEPIFMDAMGDCFLVDVRPTNKTGQQALDIMTAPNGKYHGQSNISTVNTAYYQDKNLIEAINGDDENSFINRWGGEIEFDNFTIKINYRLGEDRGVELRYGKNIPVDGFTYEADISEIVTRIYPKAYNGHKMSGNGYVDSPLIDNYPTVHAVAITFSDVKMREDAGDDDEENGVIICDNQAELDAALKQRCIDQFSTGIDQPKVTINADMVLLANTEQYKDYQILETVSLGDTIHCVNSHLGIKYDARVIALTYDSVLKRVESVTIGDAEYNYFNNLTSGVSVATANAATAANNAQAAANTADTAAKGANDAASAANEAAGNAQTAAGNANTAADNANKATTAANEAAQAANDAAEAAGTATGDASAATEAAKQAAQAANTAAGVANSAATAANNAAKAANDAISGNKFTFSGGVTGEDGTHRMAMSWNGSRVIAGVDNNAAVKQLIAVGDTEVADTGWIDAWASSNWRSDTNFLTKIRKVGRVVNIIIDLTARINLNISSESSAALVLYNINSQMTPSVWWQQPIHTVQGKQVFLKMLQDGGNGLNIRVWGENMTAGDRIMTTITYMV